jgi:KaiB domain
MGEKTELKLYLAGSGEHAEEVLTLLKEALQAVVDGNYELQVVDLLKNPDYGVHDKVFCTPTLLLRSGNLECRMLGLIKYPEELARLLCSVEANMEAAEE